jgi:hypothetical protein
MYNMKRRRSPKLKPVVKQLIAFQSVRYTNKPRLALAADLTDSIERMGEIPPSEETLMRMISEARSKEIKPDDVPWHLGIMRKPEYGISSEAIPYIFLVKDWCVRTDKETPVTVRQAFWVSQHCHVYPPPKKLKDKDIQALWQTSWVYAQYEIVCELSGSEFDTTQLDVSFWHGGAAQPLINALHRDIFSNTKHVMTASERLKGRKVKNERIHTSKRQE